MVTPRALSVETLLPRTIPSVGARVLLAAHRHQRACGLVAQPSKLADQANLDKPQGGPRPVTREVIPRVIIHGLVSSPYGNEGVQLKGIDPEAEAALQDVGKQVRGSFLKGRTSVDLKDKWRNLQKAGKV